MWNAQDSVYALETFLTARTRCVLWHAPLFTWTEFVHEEKLPLCTYCPLIADRSEQWRYVTGCLWLASILVWLPETGPNYWSGPVSGDRQLSSEEGRRRHVQEKQPCTLSTTPRLYLLKFSLSRYQDRLVPCSFSAHRSISLMEPTWPGELGIWNF